MTRNGDARGGGLEGPFTTAQILTMGLADAAASDRVLGTTVIGATGAVPTRTATLPAVFAQSYRGRHGSTHVLVTAQGKDATLLTVAVDRQAVSAPLSVDTLAPTDGDPGQQDTASTQLVAVAHASVRGALTIPVDSVTHPVAAAP